MLRAAPDLKASEELLTEFEEVIDEALAVLKAHSFGLSYRGFTDNFVIAVPLVGRFTDSEAALGAITVAMAEFQFQAEFAGLVRSRWPCLRIFYMDDTVIFGPPLLEAYHLESK